MFGFVIRRLIESLPTLFFSTIFVFGLLHLVPGDPALLMLGEDATPAELAAIRDELKLNQPLPVQYGIWMGHVLQGDLGKSATTKLPVTTLIKQRAGATLQLALAAILLSLLVGIPVGTIAALRAGGWFDWLANAISSLALSLPVFWLGIIGILIFAVRMGVLPPSGRVAFSKDPVGALKSIIMPASIMGLRLTAVLYRFVRTSIVEILSANYIRTARAKGLSNLRIVTSHVIPNALIPVVTVIGLQLGKTLGGAVIIESVFGWPGMGRLLVDSITGRDYATAQGLFLILAVAFVFINLATDITYGLVDPRVRLTGKAEA